MNDKSVVRMQSGWGRGTRALILENDPEADDFNQKDADALVEFLWDNLPAATLDLALEELKKRDEATRAELAEVLKGKFPEVF